MGSVGPAPTPDVSAVQDADDDDRRDRDLVTRVVTAPDRAARDAAFHDLVERHRHRVFAICLRYFGNRTDAADAVQETFLTLVRRIGQYRGEARFSTWLYRVTTNTCHDMARARARRPQTPVADIGDVLGDPSDDTDVEQSVVTADLARRVQAALLELDPLTRELVVLCAIEGQPYRDVAALFDLPVGTVKSRVFRARARLATLLADDAGADDGATPADTPGGTPRPRPSGRGPPA